MDGGETFVGKSLVALDTDHIKEYVFGTDKLKEIRGASSLLDYLNRIVMKELARIDPAFDDRYIIYANGGSGLFLIDADKADYFGQTVQGAFRDVTGGGATITYVVQELPKGMPEDIDALLQAPLHETLELMRYRLREAKDSPVDITDNPLHEEKEIPPSVIALPSHPFMKLCDACGVEYANPDRVANEKEMVLRDVGEESELFCASCQEKRNRDARVKENIEYIEERKRRPNDEYLWWRLISGLRENKYNLLPETERPHDFNIFRNFKGAKDYLGLIYADANSMGEQIRACKTLGELQKFAKDVDEAIYDAVCFAVAKHLKIEDHIKPRNELADILYKSLFPFDMLLLGGDDVMMVVPASVAMDVALTIAESFYERTNKKYALSVGVVLAPVKYPFGLLQGLVSNTLKFAKQVGAKRAKAHAVQQNSYGNTLINFMVVSGSTSLDFKKVYANLTDKKVSVNISGRSQQAAFYATLRPYNPEQLRILLNAIREGNTLGLGRTKLHQVREAVLKKNLTTSVGEGLAVLRNWRVRQREYVVNHIYTLGGVYQIPHRDEQNPASLFPRVTFPWFADGEKTYRTSLLDFVELYDFVAREEGDSDNEG